MMELLAMFHLFIVLSVFLQKNPVYALQCGIQSANDDWRIVGGSNTLLGEFPWQVRIDFNGQYCGAALIDNQWAVSAAHCFYGMSKSKFTFIVGQHNLYKFYGHEQVFSAERIINHPNYDNNYFSNDIALVKFNKKVKIGPYASPICLPGKGERFGVGKMCTVTGFGVTVEDGYNPEILQKVNVPIIHMTTCKAAMGYDAVSATENICAGSGGKDSCQEDSGGPLACRNTGENYKLAGVVSWGDGCAKRGKYGVYANVASYVDWINTVRTQYS